MVMHRQRQRQCNDDQRADGQQPFGGGVRRIRWKSRDSVPASAIGPA